MGVLVAATFQTRAKGSEDLAELQWLLSLEVWNVPVRMSRSICKT